MFIPNVSSSLPMQTDLAFGRGKTKKKKERQIAERLVRIKRSDFPSGWRGDDDYKKAIYRPRDIYEQRRKAKIILS